MIIYADDKQGFMNLLDQDQLADRIRDLVKEKMNRTTGQSEYNSWVNSLQYMGRVLSDNTIPNDVGIAIEYNIPQTGMRIDFMVSGYDDQNKGNAVVIELKQWEKVKRIPASDGVIETDEDTGKDVNIKSKDEFVETYTGGRLQEVSHPSYQAWSYCQALESFNENVQDNLIQLHPCAYLHNYVRKPHDPLFNEQYQVYLDKAPAFIHGGIPRLRSFIKKYICKGDEGEVLYTLDRGKIHPSKKLQDAISSMMEGNQEFVLLDHQKVVYERILRLARKCYRDNKKRTIIVQGGPGTGKSVIAVNLLCELTQEDEVCQYASRNQAPRQVYSEKLKGTMKKSAIDLLFKGTGCYTTVSDDTRNIIDTIIVDEAHRLNEKSGMFHNQGENQIKEIIYNAKCSVFFIDESQRVTLYDIGSVDSIRKWAKELGSEVYEDQLVSQLRCNGSDGYLAWVDNTLDIRETANPTLEGTNYDFQVVDSPSKLRDMIIAKNHPGHPARLVAGYCWDWIKEGKDDTNVHDIVIDDFAMSWNLRNEIYALEDTSIDEVGCIHTCQGLEFDYVGVIIGPDMRYQNGKIITDYTQRARTDQSLRGIKKMAKEDPAKVAAVADKIIKNTYRTLMTRGMKGCYVYCCDEGLQKYLSSFCQRKNMGKGA